MFTLRFTEIIALSSVWSGTGQVHGKQGFIIKKTRAQIRFILKFKTQGRCDNRLLHWISCAFLACFPARKNARASQIPRVNSLQHHKPRGRTFTANTTGRAFLQKCTEIFHLFFYMTTRDCMHHQMAELI